MFYAHSGKKSDRSDWQPLTKHLENVASGAAERVGKFGAAEWGWTAGLFHDLGKFSSDAEWCSRTASDNSPNASRKTSAVCSMMLVKGMT